MLEERPPSDADPVPRGTGALAEAPEQAVSHRRALLPAGAYRDRVIWATSLAVFGSYAAISLFRLLRLDPTSWDLAIYTQYVKQSASFRAPVADVRTAGFNLLGDHFQPIVMVIAPFFRVFPSAATLLVAQALLAALSVFPVAQAAREKLGTGPSRAIAIAYGFSWGLQQLANFDFHEIAFAVPLLAFSLSALVRGRLRAAVLWALPLVFVKEDQGFTVAAIGLYLILAGWRGSAREVAGSGGAGDSGRRRRMLLAGLFLLVWGFGWSLLAIGVIIPHFNPAHHYDYWSDGGILAPGRHASVAGLAGQLFRGWPDKLQTLVFLLLPTAFIAVGSPLALIAVPSLVLRFGSTDTSFWGTYWHYNATVMPILFIAAIDAMARINAAMAADAAAAGAGVMETGAGVMETGAGVMETGAGVMETGAGASWASGGRGPRRALMAGAQRYGAAMMVAIAVPLAFQFPLSSLWNAQTYRISSHVGSADAAMAKVPDGATVQATLDLLAPLAARTDTFWIGNSGNPRTQYVVFDTQSTDYNRAITNVPAFIAQRYPGGAYTEIYHSGTVYVFRRAATP